MAEQPVICTACNAEANVVLMEDGEPIQVTCSECGQFESYSDFQESVGQQMTDYAAEVFGKGFADLARGNNDMRYEPSRRPSHAPKFRVDLG